MRLSVVGKVVMVWTFVVLIGDGLQATGLGRERRSPFKKHKIVVINEGQIDGGGGWGAPPPPPPPPTQETVVEHHHHHYVERPPAPAPPPSHHSHSVVIEVNKEDHGAKFKEDGARIKEAFAEIDNDKKATLQVLKKDADEKLETLAQIPQLIAGDIDFLGQKIAEDLARKKEKEGGISIQVWKGKGSGQHQGGHYQEGGSHVLPPPPPAGGSDSVHHHHYYHEGVQQAPPPPPPQKEYYPPPQEYPPPPRKQYYVEEDPLYTMAKVGAQFVDQVAAGGGGGGGWGQHRVPVYEEGSSSASYGSNGEGWSHQGGGGGGGGGAGKGFSISVWKSHKLFGRRR